MEYLQGGYIVLARKIRKSPLWLSLKATHRVILIEILLQAQFQDKEVARNGEIIFLKRGQLATSYRQLVDDIGDRNITEKIVRTAINKMIKANFLAKDMAKSRAKKGLLLTVTNYDFYQKPENYKANSSDNLDDYARALQGKWNAEVGAINNKVNNFNNEKEDYNPKYNLDKGGAGDGSVRRNYGKAKSQSITGGKIGRICQSYEPTKNEFI